MPLSLPLCDSLPLTLPLWLLSLPLSLPLCHSLTLIHSAHLPVQVVSRMGALLLSSHHLADIKTKFVPAGACMASGLKGGLARVIVPASCSGFRGFRPSSVHMISQICRGHSVSRAVHAACMGRTTLSSIELKGKSGNVDQILSSQQEQKRRKQEQSRSRREESRSRREEKGKIEGKYKGRRSKQNLGN